MKTVQNSRRARALPPIVIAQEEYDRLNDIAEGLASRMPTLAAFLEQELERARLVPARRLKPNVAAMNREVEFTYESGTADSGNADNGDADGKNGSAHRQRLRLVYPDGAGEGCVSVSTMVGVALIGLAEGQTIQWTGRHGRPVRLTLHKVHD